jgi:peptidyl-prolyl cis-trans isomerase D
MLEQMRKSSQSVAIYALFGLLIVVFAISFGPQSRGTTCDQVMNGNDHYAAKVGGGSITNNDFRYGFMLSGGAQVPAKIARQEHLKEMVMDKLIERELLAAEAERLGFVATEEQVEDQIAEAKIIGLGTTHTVPRLMKDGKFNYESFRTFLQYELGVTPKSFIAEQKKELLALRVRDLLRGGVTVSTEEAKADFIQKNRQVNLEYLRFAGRRYQAEIAPTDAEIADYAAKNDAALKKAFEEKKFLYENVAAQRKLRQILVKVPADASADVEKAAKAKADGLAEKLKKGAKANGKEGVTFLEVARDSSEDTATKARGGDLGWRARGATNLTGAAEDKVFGAKAGAIVGPLRGTDGFVITKVEGSREGQLGFDQVKLELAEDKLREEQGSAKAKAAADEALAKAKAQPTATLKTVFPSPASDTEEAHAETADSAPRVEETGLFAAHATKDGIVVEGIGVSTPVAKAAFGLTAAAPLAGPFEVSGSYLVIRLKERKDPDMAEFERKKLDLVRDASLTKWERVLTDWTHARCVDVKQSKGISINNDVLRYEDSSEPVPYEPCAPRRPFGG